MIDVLVVDDHTMFRAGIRRLLGDEPDIRVSGEAPDGATAIAMIRAQRFDVVMMDINMTPRNGLEVLTSIRSEWPRLPVIMLSMYVEPQYARHALKARASGYLSKDASPEELVSAIHQVARGGIYLSPGVKPVTPSTGESTVDDPHQRLSAREMQVFQKIVRGVSLTDIGTQMCVSVKTIGTHRARILEKLGLGTNAELVQYAVRHGLLE